MWQMGTPGSVIFIGLVRRDGRGVADAAGVALTTGGSDERLRQTATQTPPPPYVAAPSATWPKMAL